MKRILLFTFASLLFLVLLFFGVNYFLESRQKIVVKSRILDSSFSKSAQFNEFEAFLEDMGFWKPIGVSSGFGAGRITPNKLTIILTNKPQGGGLLKQNLSDTNFYSSYSQTSKKNEVILQVHINTKLCKLPACNPELS